MAHPKYLREKARELRATKKFTIDELAERLALSRTTIYYWVRDIPIPYTRDQALAQRRASRATRTKHRLKREAAYEEGRRTFTALAQDPTFRDFVNLYIGEGSKRCRNTVALCNSDPAVIAIAQRWICRLASNPVTYSVQYHADQRLDELRTFWGSHLGVPGDAIRFQRKSNSSGLKSRTWRCRYGVLAITANDTYLRARLRPGWIPSRRGGFTLTSTGRSSAW
jgi:excisionase family DNA binding protein